MHRLITVVFVLAFCLSACGKKGDLAAPKKPEKKDEDEQTVLMR